MALQVLLYYQFAHIADARSFADEHRTFCLQLGLRGRILIAHEGINGTVSGTKESCTHYMDFLKSIDGFEETEFKIDEADEHAFKKLSVRVRAEIITLGVPLSGPVSELAGKHLTPAEWMNAMRREDVVVLDGRNRYESDLGHFENAICPPVENFREIPEWILKNREAFHNKTILTYCTGGIRCEKLSAWMRDAGFEHIYQLSGGICNYAKDEATQGEGFLGVNVVFDDRVVATAGAKSTPMTRCRECGELSTNYVNCANVDCNDRIVLCPTCEERTFRCCSEACRDANRHRKKNQKLRFVAQ